MHCGMTYSHSAPQLKARLQANDQLVSGSKTELQARIADCLLNGMWCVILSFIVVTVHVRVFVGCCVLTKWVCVCLYACVVCVPVCMCVSDIAQAFSRAARN